MSALVCERWHLPFDPAAAQARSDSHRWYGDWVVRKPRETSLHVSAGYHAYRALLSHVPEEASVVEAFGGLGCQSLIIRHLYRPRSHLVLDSHPDAATHLRAALPGATVLRADAFTTPLPDVDLYGLDFGDFTIHRAVRGPHRSLLHRAANAEPAGIVLTDIAGPRLHLHRDRYATLLDHSADDYPTYLTGLARWLNRTIGYGLVAAYWHRWSAVLALTPMWGHDPAPRIHPVPEHPIGLQLVPEPPA